MSGVAQPGGVQISTFTNFLKGCLNILLLPGKEIWVKCPTNFSVLTIDNMHIQNRLICACQAEQKTMLEIMRGVKKVPFHNLG